jgi:hypothetical protein
MNAPLIMPSPGIQPEIAVGAIPDDERVFRSLFVVVRTAIAARTTMPNTVLTTARTPSPSNHKSVMMPPALGEEILFLELPARA